MKKVIAVLLCAVTVFASAGCKRDGGATKQERTEIGGEPLAFDDTNEYLVKNGKSDYKIAVSSEASKTEKYAAEELQYFIEKSTAVKLPIVNDDSLTHDNLAKYLSVGENKLLAAQTDVTIDYNELGENGVTVNTKGNCVYMAGATETGTLFSVYRFLHYQVGYNAYAYDCVEVDYRQSCKLKDFTYKYVPSLGLLTAEDAELSGETKVKEAFRMYAYASKNGGYDMNGNLFNGLWCHTMNYIVTQTLDQPRVEVAEKAEKQAKFNEIKEELLKSYGLKINEAYNDEAEENDFDAYAGFYKMLNPDAKAEDKDSYKNYRFYTQLIPEDSLNEEGYLGYANFVRGFERACETLFSSMKNYKDDIPDEVLNLYGYILDLDDRIVPRYVKVTEEVKDKDGNVKKDENGNVIRQPKLENGNYVYETDEEGNPVLETDENGKPYSDVKGYDNYIAGRNAAYEKGAYHAGGEWQKNVKKIRLWNNNQTCYSKQEAVDLAVETLTNKYINVANGPYLMLGVTDGSGSCDCEDCKAAEEIYGGPAGVQTRFMNEVAKGVEAYMEKNNIKKNIVLVEFAYYTYREPPVKTENGKYVAVHKDAIPKSDGQVQVGVLYAPIEACYTHPITDDGETCDKNARIAEEMKAWASITNNLMMYSYGTNFQAYKYHFNNWSHIGDSIRFYEKCGLKYYFEQACTQNGVSPMSSMRAYVRSRLAWNASYDTQDLINEFIEHYYGDGAEGVKQYFSTVMEAYERIYAITETEDQTIYYTLTRSEYWTRPLLLELESCLEKADYAVDLGYSAYKDVYKERIFREYFLMKDDEYMMYSGYLNREEYDRLEELVMYGREKYNAYLSSEKTNNG